MKIDHLLFEQLSKKQQTLLKNKDAQPITQAELDNRIVRSGETVKFTPEIESDIINTTLDTEIKNAEIVKGGLYRVEEILLVTVDVENKLYEYEFTLCVVTPPDLVPGCEAELRRNDLLWYREIMQRNANS